MQSFKVSFMHASVLWKTWTFSISSKELRHYTIMSDVIGRQKIWQNKIIIAINLYIAMATPTKLPRNKKSLRPTQNQRNTNISLSPDQIIVQINKVNQAHMPKLVSLANENHESRDWELRSRSPIFDTFYEDGKTTVIKSMCDSIVIIWYSLDDADGSCNTNLEHWQSVKDIS